MNRRWLAGTATLIVWLVLTVLWLAWTVLVVAAWLVALAFGRRRDRRKITKAFTPAPSWARVLAWMPGRPHPVLRHQERRACRMSAIEVAEKRGLLWQRDGDRCQECDRRLDLDAHHLAPEHPEVHHLVAWSKCWREWWANALWNLCLLCGPCNRRIGTGTTWQLRRKQAELRTLYAHEIAEAA
ncbi:MAG TPA: HNH endonuclease signature motif containing protein [Propionibacteriaceae bacterium]|nr:HNH endonuclease signature motif containing protein [Propionibacteriaceae bacterium]